MSYTPPTMPVAPPPPPPAAGPAAWLKSPVGLARATMALLGVGMAVDVFSLVAGVGVFDVVSDLIDNGWSAGAEDRADRADSLYGLSGVLQAVGMLATAVVFICWFRRVRVNAEVFAPDGHTKARGWAVGGWFVPVVNLWFPRRIAADIWDASAPATPDAPLAGPPQPAGWEVQPKRTLLNAWWTLWLCTGIFGQIASRQYANAEEPEAIKRAVVSLMASDVLNIAAAVVAILFVRRLTAMQDAKARTGPGTHA
ncbi:DUF4328 domain-containing protein [Streptomyces aurantiacus]|uniref:DUF4328 domain-containing protein n=1 Tax=Streptomyces aurantiacus JA 4570 TaxID=1286094 RepID=S3ZPY0_9ACTN|nr:DUF4328 domain-containing protein [Streptomyces aurantiacus]EPH45263.1 hypothetical protein STRAU_1662 [Streptomyces aurantiacus JA 4570]